MPIPVHPPTERPSEDGPDEFLMQLKGGRSILYRKVLGLDRPTERDLEKARANLDRDDVQQELARLRNSGGPVVMFIIDGTEMTEVSRLGRSPLRNVFGLPTGAYVVLSAPAADDD